MQYRFLRHYAIIPRINRLLIKTTEGHTSLTHFLTLPFYLGKPSITGCSLLLQSIISMQTPEIFGYISTDLKKFKEQSKEIFFSTKRHAKRQKQPSNQHEQNEKVDTQIIDLDQSFEFKSTDKESKHPQSELLSTFGDDNALTFKSQPPKRKTHLNHKIRTGQKLANSTQFTHENNMLTTKLSLLASEWSAQRQGQISLIQPMVSKAEFKLTDFHLLKKMGSGSYSEVYMAMEKRSGFICALKILEKQKMKEMKVQQNVVDQLKIQSCLNHPNIAKLYGYFHDEKYIVLVCECATDQNLYEALKQPKHNVTKFWPRNQITKVVSQLCDSVEQIHRHSIIHRDIKPENILLTMFNTIKICDFGWSIYNPNRQPMSVVCGTPLYQAPELIIHSEYNQSVDVWAIGVIAYELLTHQNPFEIANMTDLKRKMIHEQIVFHKVTNKVAIDFLQKAIDKNPAKRSSISELADHPFLTLEQQNGNQ